MGRAFKGTALPPEPTKLVHSGEYVLEEVKYSGEQTNSTIWRYDFPKKKVLQKLGCICLLCLML